MVSSHDRADRSSSPSDPAAGVATPDWEQPDWEQLRAGAQPDWEQLRAGAASAAALAYAPYSGLRVGAAGFAADGRLVSGCNVENASYGLTLCAECGLVSGLAASGGGRLVAVSVVAADGRPLAPCGRCRQLLLEHGGPGLLVDGGAGRPPARLGELLPGAFDAVELAARRAGESPETPDDGAPDDGAPEYGAPDEAPDEENR